MRKGFFKLNKCPKLSGRRACAKVFLSSANVPNYAVGGWAQRFKFKKCPQPCGRGMCARGLAIGLMTMPKLSKIVSKNVPNYVVGGRAQRLF